MRFPRKLPADITPNRAAIEVGVAVQDTMRENGGDRAKASEAVWAKLPAAWRNIVGAWALTRAESLAFRQERRPVVGLLACGTHGLHAPTGHDNDGAADGQTRFDAHVSNASVAPDPNMRAAAPGGSPPKLEMPRPHVTFFRQPGAELDYPVWFPAGRKRLGDATAKDWLQRARDNALREATYKSKRRAEERIAKKYEGDETMDVVWSRLTDTDRAYVRRELGIKVRAA